MRHGGSTALKVLLTTSGSPSSGTAAAAAYATGVTVTPSTGTVTATNFAGNINGFSIGMSVPAGSKLTDTTYTNGTGLDLSGTTFSLADTAVSAGDYGPSAGSTLAHSGTFTVPYITVDAQGRITAASTKTFTLPASGNTDTKVTQTASTSTSALPLLASTSTAPAGSATTAVYKAGVTLTPSTGTITATTFSGDFVGTLNGTTIPASPKLTDTTYTNGTGLSLSGTTFSLANTAVTAGDYGPTQTAATTLAYSGTFNVPKFTVDAQGRLTSAGHITFTLPASDNTDTKVTQTAYSTSANLPLLTSTSTNPAGSALGTYYNTSVYLNHSTKMLTTVGLTVSTAGNVSGVQKSWTTLSLPIGTSWSGSAAPYTYALTVSGILATDIPTVDMRPSGTYATDKTMEENWCQVYRGVTSANTITFYAHEKPSAAIPITIKVVR